MGEPSTSWQNFNFRDDDGSAQGMQALRLLLAKLQEAQANPRLKPSVNNLLMTEDLMLTSTQRLPSSVAPMHLEGGEGVPVMHGPMQANVVPHPLQGPLQTDGAKKKQYHGQERHVGKIREEGDFHDDDDEPLSRSRHKKRTNERRTKRSRRNSSGGSSSSSQSGRSSHGRFPKKGVFLDGGSRVNILPKSTCKRLTLIEWDPAPFQIGRVNFSYPMMLGRPWLRAAKVKQLWGADAIVIKRGKKKVKMQMDAKKVIPPRFRALHAEELNMVEEIGEDIEEEFLKSNSSVVPIFEVDVQKIANSDGLSFFKGLVVGYLLEIQIGIQIQAKMQMQLKILKVLEIPQWMLRKAKDIAVNDEVIFGNADGAEFYHGDCQAICQYVQQNADLMSKYVQHAKRILEKKFFGVEDFYQEDFCQNLQRSELMMYDIPRIQHNQRSVVQVSDHGKVKKRIQEDFQELARGQNPLHNSFINLDQKEFPAIKFIQEESIEEFFAINEQVAFISHFVEVVEDQEFHSEAFKDVILMTNVQFNFGDVLVVESGADLIGLWSTLGQNGSDILCFQSIQLVVWQEQVLYYYAVCLQDHFVSKMFWKIRLHSKRNSQISDAKSYSKLDSDAYADLEVVKSIALEREQNVAGGVEVAIGIQDLQKDLKSGNWITKLQTEFGFQIWNVR
ncbi:hypothetical protein L7F22_002464 [Adiantum nelumboides]|nr:hypothetical protein [Adiantum nelumboides]